MPTRCKTSERGGALWLAQSRARAFDLVERAVEYRWSSAAFHAGEVSHDVLVERNDLLGLLPDARAWKQLMEDHVPAARDEHLRQLTRTGRPCGDRAFVARAGEICGRTLLPKKSGPAPKAPFGSESWIPRPSNSPELALALFLQFCTFVCATFSVAANRSKPNCCCGPLSRAHRPRKAARGWRGMTIWRALAWRALASPKF